MTTDQRLHRIIEPVVTELGLTLFDLDYGATLLKVTVDKPGRTGEPGHQDGVDIDAIAAATRAISRALDEADPIAGHYTLEVSSPGLERALRTPSHYRWAVGRDVTIKLGPGAEGERRLRGRVTDADDAVVTVAPDAAPDEAVRVAYDAIEKARTVFAWGPSGKPGKDTKAGSGRTGTQKPREKRKAS
jgi:ribosome maturation factor RimP